MTCGLVCTCINLARPSNEPLWGLETSTLPQVALAYLGIASLKKYYHSLLPCNTIFKFQAEPLNIEYLNSATYQKHKLEALGGNK